MAASATTTPERVRALNDHLRQHRVGGTVVITQGVRVLGDKVVALILTAVARFDVFETANDPYDEHDFGAVEVQGCRVFFKIDTYDRELCWHSPDPADPAHTHRVMTLMLAEEY